MNGFEPGRENILHSETPDEEASGSLGDFTFELMLHDGVIALYRGRHRSSAATVLLAQAANEADGIEAGLQLNNEYALRDALDPAWALKPRRTLLKAGCLALLYGDLDVVPLDRISKRLLDIDVFLDHAASITDAIRYMHASGILHNNLKPSNILVHRDGSCRIRNFGSALRISGKGAREPGRAAAAAPSFAYMSPEHTGRTRHAVGTRSDLYSLGVIFYELLTGLLPCNLGADADRAEWIHQHLASDPTAPHILFPGIPKQLSIIVLKLLAKNPDARYQTATGLERDLRRCRRTWKTLRRIDEFQPGLKEVGAELSFANKLYSREDSLQTLVTAYEQVTAARTRTLAIVRGRSGVGKSALLASLLSELRLRHACVAEAKIDQYRRDLPYAALVLAIESLVMHIIGQPDKELLFWRNRLLRGLGDYGALALNLIPALGYLVGDLPSVDDLPAPEAQTRFRTVMQRLFRAFAPPGQPLVLVIDDLQWIDLPSIQLLEHLMNCADDLPLLLVVAYREESVASGSPFEKHVGGLQPGATRAHQVCLAGLELKAVERMVADVLRQNIREVRELACLVHEKTDGNPFFVKQFLQATVDDGLIVPDSANAVWTFDLAAIRDRGYTENVAALVLQRLSRMPLPTQYVLGTLACLGRTSTMELLATIHGGTVAEVYEALEPAIDAEAVSFSKGSIGFCHDRVQEAAYLLIEDGRRLDIHLRIGKRLLEDAISSTHDEDLFRAFDHIVIASPLIVCTEECRHVAHWALQAARAAKRAIAYDSAKKYIDAGLTFLDSLPDTPHEGQLAELSFQLQLEKADCLLTGGKLDEANLLVDKLLSMRSSLADKTTAYRMKAELHLRQSENAASVEVALEGLRSYGIHMERHPAEADCEAAYRDILNKLSARPDQVLLALPQMQDREVEAAMSLLSILSASASFTDERLHFIQLCQALDLTLRHGMTGAATAALSWFGVLVGHRFGKYRDGFSYGQLARTLVTRHRYLAYEAKTLLPLDQLSVWTQPLSFSIDCARAGFEAGVAHGDITMACFECCHQVANYLTRGDHLDTVLAEAERGLAFVRQAGFRDVEAILMIQTGFIENLRKAGNTPFSGNGMLVSDLDRLTGQGRERMPTLVFWFWLYKAISHYLADEVEAAMSCMGEAEQYAWSAPGHIHLLDFHLFQVLILCAHETTLHDPEALRARIQPHYEKIAEWAAINPDTFADKKALVDGELARLRGDRWVAMERYGEAIAHAASRGFVQYAAYAHERAASLCLASGLHTPAEAHLNGARNAYRSWGAAAKAKRLERAHPRLFQNLLPGTLAKAAVLDSEEGWELFSVLRSVRALSEEIRLDSLVKILMTIAIEHAGAQRGLLIRLQQGSPLIAARAATSSVGIAVDVIQQVPTEKDLPLSMLHTTMRTLQRSHFAGSAQPNAFMLDPYLRDKPQCAVMCIPLVKRGELIGVLHLENCLRPDAFTDEHVRVLEILAAQAAISLEIARLYAELVEENIQRQRVESALRASEATLELGEQISHTGSWQWDTRQNVISCSAECCRIFGRDPEQRVLTLADFLAYIHPDNRSLMVDTLRLCTEEHIPFHLEYRIVRPDGSIRYMSGVGKMAANESGSVHYVGTVTDITERRAYEDALRISQAELARVARISTVGQLTASIAHEINQPLMSIVSNGGASIRWLKRNPPELGEVLSGLEEIVSEAGRAGHIIRSLQALTRNSEPVMNQVDLHDVIRHILAIARSDIERRTVSIQLSLEARSHDVMGDSVQLQQVLLNLVVNAVDAMSDVDTRPRVLSIWSENPDSDHISISIQDTGVGLDAEQKARIFDAFYTTKQTGMGMGLAIAQSIVEAHHGDVRVASATPQGSTFQLVLPICGSTHVAAPAPGPKA